MPICSYLVFPVEGTAEAVASRLSALGGCEVTPALNRDVLLLVTETDSSNEEEALQERLQGVEGVVALVLTFGEIVPMAAPSGRGEREERP